MARKKDPPKPITALRFDFVESLENLCHQAMMMVEAVDTLVQHGNLNERLKATMAERSKALRAALISED